MTSDLLERCNGALPQGDRRRRDQPPRSTTSSLSVAAPVCCRDDPGQELTGGKEPGQGVNPTRSSPSARACRPAFSGRAQGRPVDRRHPRSASASRPRAVGSRSSSTATRPSRPSAARSSRRPTTTSRAVLIQVFQGEREIAQHNKVWAPSRLTGVAPAPAASRKIEVTFDIDANGIVHVSAKDMGTGKEQSMTISGGARCPRGDRADGQEAEAHAEEDRKRVEESRPATRPSSSSTRPRSSSPTAATGRRAERKVVEEALADLKGRRRQRTPRPASSELKARPRSSVRSRR